MHSNIFSDFRKLVASSIIFWPLDKCKSNIHSMSSIFGLYQLLKDRFDSQSDSQFQVEKVQRLPVLRDVSCLTTHINKDWVEFNGVVILSSLAPACPLVCRDQLWYIMLYPSFFWAWNYFQTRSSYNHLWEVWVFGLVHFLFENTEGEEFMTYSAACH